MPSSSSSSLSLGGGGGGGVLPPRPLTAGRFDGAASAPAAEDTEAAGAGAPADSSEMLIHYALDSFAVETGAACSGPAASAACAAEESPSDPVAVATSLL